MHQDHRTPKGKASLAIAQVIEEQQTQLEFVLKLDKPSHTLSKEELYLQASYAHERHMREYSLCADDDLDDVEECEYMERQPADVYGPPQAPDALRVFMRGGENVKHMMYGKKVFNKYDGRICSFCIRKGHGIWTCMVRPPGYKGWNETRSTLQRQKAEFVMNLLATAGKTSTVAEIWTECGSKTEAVRQIMEIGEMMNANNPWAGSTKRRDKLRKKLGYWWAVGADRTVLG